MEKPIQTQPKIMTIGIEGERKAKEYLSKNGYIVFDKEIIEGEIENQVKIFEDLGCVLSDKAKNYLENNSIFVIGNILAKKIADNKLCCFETKTSANGLWISGITQFEENCIARKNEIGVYYILFNHGLENLEIFDIKDLWFENHATYKNIPNQPISIIKKEKAIEKKNKYCSNTFALFEIVKCLKNRELCLLNQKIDFEKKNIRYLLAFNLDYLKKHLDRFHVDKSLTQLYHSVALLKPSVPVFSYNLKERRTDEEYKEFNKNYINYVEKYNLFIDLDADWDWEKALRDALQIKEVFDEYKLPYYVLNSSFKGFHFHIPANYMPNENISELLENINEAIYNLKGIYGLETIDTSIFDLKRVCKIPYSYVSDNSICLPLDDTQLKNYKPEMVKMENVLSKIKLKNRGLLLRTHNSSEEELKENVLKFLKDFQ